VRPSTHPSVIREKSTWRYLNVCKFQLSISHGSRDIKGVQNFTMGCQEFTQTGPSFLGESSRAFGGWQRRVPHSALRQRLSMWSFVAKLFAI